MRKWLIYVISLLLFITIELAAQDSTYFSKHLNFSWHSQRGEAIVSDGEEELFLSFHHICDTLLNGSYPNCGGYLKMDWDANIEWIDTSRMNRARAGHYALFWDDDLLYMGNVIKNEERDSQIFLSAINTENELIWDTVLDTGIYEEAFGSFIPYEDGFMVQIGMNFWSCPDCDTTRMVFFDEERNIVRDWKHTFNNNNPDLAGVSLKSLGDGTFIGTDIGCTVLALCGGVTRFDSLGNVLWQEFLDQTAMHSRISVPELAMLPDSDFVVSWISSYTGEPSFTEGVFVLYRMNKEGEIVWTKYFDHDIDQEIYLDEIRTAANGDIIGFGQRITQRNNDAPLPNGVECGYVCRVSPEGELLWERTICDFTGWNDPYMYFYDMVELPNGDLFLTGEIDIPNPDNPTQRTTAIWLVRTDSTGCLEPDCGSFEVLTAQNDLHKTEGYTKLLVFPNPVNDKVQLHWPDVFDGKQYHWRLVDGFGRELLEKTFHSGEMQTTSLTDLQKGIYFWQLYADDVLMDVGKLIKQ